MSCLKEEEVERVMSSQPYVPPHLRKKPNKKDQFTPPKNKQHQKNFHKNPPTPPNFSLQDATPLGGKNKAPAASAAMMRAASSDVRLPSTSSSVSRVMDTWHMGNKMPPAFALPQQPIHERLKKMSFSPGSYFPSYSSRPRPIHSLVSSPHTQTYTQTYVPSQSRGGSGGGPPSVSSIFSGTNIPPDHSHPPPYGYQQYQYHQVQQRSLQNNPAPNPLMEVGGPIPGGLPIEKWFLSKFCSNKAAYDVFTDEFQYMIRKGAGSKAWPPFLEPRNRKRIVQAKEFTVNAHWVEGMHGKRYITCEGPNPSSVYDFWEMVWQENVGGILMLNQPYEERLYPKTYNPAHETIQYWPLKAGETKTFAPWKIKCLWTKLKIRPSHNVPIPSDGSDPEETYVYRVTKISLVESNPITNPKAKEMLHVCYYRWPDGQIPSPLPGDPLGEYAPTSTLLTDILQSELRSVRGPLVVHCHAGVGRTGVAIAVDVAATRLRHKYFADVRETVRRIREQRPRAVMNVWQYTYINLSLGELALREGLLPDTVEMPLHGKKRNNLGEVRQLLEECWRDMTEDFRRICYPDEMEGDDGDFEEDFEDEDDLSLLNFHKAQDDG